MNCIFEPRGTKKPLASIGTSGHHDRSGAYSLSKAKVPDELDPLAVGPVSELGPVLIVDLDEEEGHGLRRRVLLAALAGTVLNGLHEDIAQGHLVEVDVGAGLAEGDDRRVDVFASGQRQEEQR